MFTPSESQRSVISAFLEAHEELLRREIIFLTEDVIDPPKPAVNQELAIHAPEALQEGPAARLANFLLELTKGMKGEQVDEATLRDGLSIVSGLVNEAHQEERVLTKMTSGGALESRMRQKFELRKDEPFKPEQKKHLDRLLARRGEELKAVKDDMPVLEALQHDIISLLKALDIQTTVRPRHDRDGETRGVA